MNLFKVGDKIIYPNQGIGVIEDIRLESYFGEEFKIYHVRILTNDTLVLVPFSNADEIGIRKPITSSKVDTIFGFMSEGTVDVTMNWKGRYREHVDLMRSGTVLDVAQVFKGLYYLNSIKPLSFREKKMMEKAKDLIVTEISEVSSLSEQAIEQRLFESLSSCFKGKADRLNF